MLMLTPEYRARLEEEEQAWTAVRGPLNRAVAVALWMIALVGPSFAQHSTVPIVLVDGFNFRGCASPRNVTTDFDNLSSLLSQDSGQTPYYFDYCQVDENASIDQIGADFGRYLSGLGLPQVDVIAYSMGGLIVRSYLSGLSLSNNTVDPPISPGIRKLVLIGTPNFGALGSVAAVVQALGGIQGPQMLPGTQLIWDLNTWNQEGDDLRGIDTVVIAGNGDPTYVSDGIVSVNSASVSFAFSDGDERTRAIGNYCHTSNQLADLGTLCAGPGIAYVVDRTHPSYQIIRSFLDGTTAWESVGMPGSQASPYGGLLWYAFSAGGEVLSIDLPPNAPMLMAPNQPSASLSYGGSGGAFYDEFFPAPSVASLDFTSGGASYEVSDITINPGSYLPLSTKFGPTISRFGVVPAVDVPPPGGLSVAAGSLISIFGQNLSSSTASAPYPWPAQLNDTTVNIDGTPCPLTYAAPLQVNGLVPSNLMPGLHNLTLVDSQGQHSINLMIESIVPALFYEAGNAAAAQHSNYQPVSASSPAAVGESISLYATGLGPVTLLNGLEVANQTPSVYIGGQSATVTFAGRAPGYQGLDQINVQIPAGVQSGASVPVVVVSGNRTSNQVLLAVN
jgi:uncharacterized protein (TIGR03437 family)